VAQGLALAKQDPPKTAETSQQPQLPQSCQFQIEVYSAQTRQDAEARANKLRQLGFSCSITPVQLNGNETWYRVRLLGFDSRESAIAAGDMLRTKGIIDDYSIIQLISPPVSK
jgi:cell division protein FtsN